MVDLFGLAQSDIPVSEESPVALAVQEPTLMIKSEECNNVAEKEGDLLKCVCVMVQSPQIIVGTNWWFLRKSPFIQIFGQAIMHLVSLSCPPGRARLNRPLLPFPVIVIAPSIVLGVIVAPSIVNIFLDRGL